MATDALDPGPDNDYPFMPRNEDGTLDTTRMPIGLRQQPGRNGKPVLIDVEPTMANGLRPSDVVPPRSGN